MAESSSPPAGRMPAIFLAHGSPMLLDDEAWMKELANWGAAMPRPRALLILSAHWLDAPLTIGATRTVPLVYDFYGFPERYYAVKYASPGAPELAKRVRGLVEKSGQAVASDENRGLDHGAYVPLIPMYPSADIPVLQVSVPSSDPAKLLELGRVLAPLRDEGVLIMGSGFLTHNMRTIDVKPGAKAPSWATEFDAWSGEVLAKKDVDALMKYREIAPGVRESLPTQEHFLPVIATMGAALEAGGAPTFPIQGFTYGSFTKRSVQYG